MTVISRFLVPAMLLGLLPLASQAQVNPALSDINGAVEQARTLIQTERKLTVQQNLMMTGTEEAAFWPIYDKYTAEIKKVTDLRVKVITDYAANYDELTDAVADRLMADSFKYNERLNTVRKDYMGRFKKVLPSVKVARFYQIENKLDAIGNFALAREIPLVPMAAPAAPIAKP